MSTFALDVRTARLQLRSPRASDAERLFPLFARWEVIRWLSSPPWPYRREDMQRYIDQHADGASAAETRFVICLEGAPIGVIGVRMRPASAVQRQAGPNIGYWLAQDYWGRGYMSEVLRGLVGHVFAATAHDAIYSGAFVGNAASLRVQEKVGFVRDGEAMLFANPHGKEMPHLDTVLTRAGFAVAMA